mgnify:CR=1 FL=1
MTYVDKQTSVSVKRASRSSTHFAFNPVSALEPLANLMFGTPDQVVQKLGMYEAIGTDAFIYYASMGLGMAEQRRSLELFIDRVMPHFSAATPMASRQAGMPAVATS